MIDGEAELLQGFDFNINGKLGTTLFAPSMVTLDRVTGDAKVDIEAFTPQTAVAAPSGTTHFKILSAAMEILNRSLKALRGISDDPVLAPYHQEDLSSSDGEDNGIVFFHYISNCYFRTSTTTTKKYKDFRKPRRQCCYKF